MNEHYRRLLQQRDKVQKKVKQEEFALKQSNYYKNQQERKARSRRLIQKGALLEKYFNINNLSVKETEDFLKIFAEFINNHKPIKYQNKNNHSN
ncbi:hypothetical protein [Apilactobacillus quenuiae]|uniref:hypothetical protein n=1 Tax=Apilactobacillus quenuiae TaxID=2008377 RepID=UPI000D01B85E|nr:hypothetical protein [Apilactobacillus quenuiae]